MSFEERCKRYEALVSQVKMCKRCDGLTQCSSCEEVNLWSYWVGGREHLNAKILLVGQDWGSVKEFDAVNEVIESRKNSFNGHTKFYYQKGNSETDDRLARLLESIGYNVCGGQSTRALTELFFTNYVLCYRTGGKISGGFRSQWQNNCKDHFTELVRIIQPEIILCLGKSVYQGVRKAAELSVDLPLDYNAIINQGSQQMQIGGVNCRVFPLAHPGAMGTLNRCRLDGKNAQSKDAGEKMQKQDWKQITAYLDKP